MSEQLPATAARRASLVVNDNIALLDTAKFEQMLRISKLMASCSLVPHALLKDGDSWLPTDAATANCMLIVNQAVRWGMDPFAVAQCASVVHGRLMWEGKLVQAVIESKLPAVRFSTAYQGTGLDRAIQVSAKIDGATRNVDGTVRDWHTRKKNGEMADAWVRQPDTMLHYRGMRQWARQWAPALMLGVYTDDEMDELQDNRRAESARVVSGPPAPPEEDTTRALVEPAREAAKPRGTRTPPPPPTEETTHDDVRTTEDAGEAVTVSDDGSEAPAADAGDRGGDAGSGAKPATEDPLGLSPKQLLAALETGLANAATTAAAEAVWEEHEAELSGLGMRDRQAAQALYLDKLDSLS